VVDKLVLVSKNGSDRVRRLGRGVLDLSRRDRLRWHHDRAAQCDCSWPTVQSVTGSHRVTALQYGTGSRTYSHCHGRKENIKTDRGQF